MAAYSWPPSLPRWPNKDGYGESLRARLLRSPPDMGPAKQRYLGRLPTVLRWTFDMHESQLETLRVFVFETLKCTARFDMTHPVTGAAMEVRLVPQDDGEMYAVSALSGPNVAVSFTLEVLP